MHFPATVGSPPFRVQAVVAQAAGAVGLVVINSEPGGMTFAMPGAGDVREGEAWTSGVSIPVAMVREGDGAGLG